MKISPRFRLTYVKMSYKPVSTERSGPLRYNGKMDAVQTKKTESGWIGLNRVHGIFQLIKCCTSI